MRLSTRLGFSIAALVCAAAAGTLVAMPTWNAASAAGDCCDGKACNLDTKTCAETSPPLPTNCSETSEPKSCKTEEICKICS